MLKITNYKITELTPYQNNARTHSDEQVKEIAASIKEFGFNNPILIDEKKMIIAGHGRLLAASILGLSEVPTIELKNLSDTKKRAYILADNRIALNAGWSSNKLQQEFEALLADNFDITLTGFTSDEINSFLNPEVLTEGLMDENSVPEIKAEAITKLGDQWILGNHRLKCANSTCPEAVDRLMNGEKADMVFTDPPYGINYQGKMRTKTPMFDVLENDDVILDAATNLFLFLKDNSAAFIWTSHSVYPQWRSQFDEYYKNTIIWHKAAGGMGDLAGNYATDYEMALFCVKGKVKFKNGRGMAVWRIDKDPNYSYEHPTQKPVALAEKAINDLVVSGSIVLDLFGGSGSTLIACEKTNRKCYMMEICPSYCDVIIKRWQDFSGKKAILESTQQTFEEVSNACQEKVA